MQQHWLALLALAAAAATAPALFARGRGITDTLSSPNVKLKSVDLSDVRWTEGF